MKRAFLGLLVACAWVLATASAHVPSDYPNKPVKRIIPLPVGGTSDIMGRMAADQLSRALKQPFVIENIGGAGGVSWWAFHTAAAAR